MFNKKRKPLIDQKHQWNDALIRLFFSKLHIRAGELDDFNTIEYQVFIAGFQRKITNEESEFILFGHIFMKDTDYGKIIAAVPTQIIIKEDSDEKLCKTSEEQDFCGHFTLNSLYGTSSTGTAICECVLFLSIQQISTIEKILEIECYNKGYPEISLRLKVPKDLDVSSITEENYYKRRYEIERYWFSATHAFSENALTKNSCFAFENF